MACGGCLHRWFDVTLAGGLKGRITLYMGSIALRFDIGEINSNNNATHNTRLRVMVVFSAIRLQDPEPRSALS